MACPLAERDPNSVPRLFMSNSLKRPREEDLTIGKNAHGYGMKWDCNQIRTKINKLIRSGDYKVTHFQKELGISASSYGNFMKQKGVDGGINNQTFDAAHDFFLKREQQGIKEPKAKKAKAADAAEHDVSGITLAGEDEEDAVPVYDTCDDLRKTINAHLRKPGVTQAALCHALGDMYHPPRKLSASSLGTFLKHRGPTAGADSAVYYAGYVYFEKLRLKHKREPTKKRLEVEHAQPNGMPLRSSRGGFLCKAGERPVEDQYGRISFR